MTTPGPGLPPVPPPSGSRTSGTLAWLLDDLIRIPGTRFGIGLDALIGLVPGVGDLVGTALSGAIMVDAIGSRVPMTVLVRMSWNVIIDALLGLIPFVGDVADVAHRSNRKNLRLLQKAQLTPSDRPPSPGYVIGAGLLLVGTLVAALALAGLALWFLIRLLFG